MGETIDTLLTKFNEAVKPKLKDLLEKADEPGKEELLTATRNFQTKMKEGDVEQATATLLGLVTVMKSVSNTISSSSTSSPTTKKETTVSPPRPHVPPPKDTPPETVTPPQRGGNKVQQWITAVNGQSVKPTVSVGTKTGTGSSGVSQPGNKPTTSGNSPGEKPTTTTSIPPIRTGIRPGLKTDTGGQNLDTGTTPPIRTGLRPTQNVKGDQKPPETTSNVPPQTGLRPTGLRPTQNVKGDQKPPETTSNVPPQTGLRPTGLRPTQNVKGDQKPPETTSNVPPQTGVRPTNVRPTPTSKGDQKPPETTSNVPPQSGLRPTGLRPTQNVKGDQKPPETTSNVPPQTGVRPTPTSKGDQKPPETTSNVPSSTTSQSTGSQTGQTPPPQENKPPTTSGQRTQPTRTVPNPQTSPSRTQEVKQKNEGVKRAIDELNQEIATANREKKRQLVTEAVTIVRDTSAQGLAEMSAQQQIQILQKLKCLRDENGKVGEVQRKAIAKVYGSIRLDKEFRGHDDNMRRQVLEDLVKDPVVKNIRANWNKTPELTEEKKVALKKVQDLQCARLGFTPDVMSFGEIEDGSAGFCSGKKVMVSTDPTAITDFNEVFNTVIHETTHAYQRHLVEELDAGRLTVEDPRYAQAWLFKLNDEAYAKPPAKLSETDRKNPTKKQAYDSDYLAYKRQPLEEHAWKAGDEAGRVFDVEAVGLELASLTEQIIAFVPSKGSAASSLLQRFQQRKTILEGTDLVEEVDGLAQEAYDVALKQAGDLIPTIGHWVVGGFEKYSAEWTQAQSSTTNPREKFKVMGALAKKLAQLTEQGKTDQAEYKKAELGAKGLYPSIGSYVPGGFELYSNQWLEIANSTKSYREKAIEMTALWNTLKEKTDEGKKALEEYSGLWSKVQCQTQEEVNEANRINQLKVSPSDKLKAFKESPKLVNVRKRAGLSG